MSPFFVFVGVGEGGFGVVLILVVGFRGGVCSFSLFLFYFFCILMLLRSFMLVLCFLYFHMFVCEFLCLYSKF